jgi:CRISPR-associated protein Cas1
MEPFRPQIDLTVREIIEEGGTEVDKDAKARLSGTMTVDLPTAAGMTPLFLCIERLAFSLSQVFAGEGTLDLPKRPTPLGA